MKVVHVLSWRIDVQEAAEVDDDLRERKGADRNVQPVLRRDHRPVDETERCESQKKR
jgi:hypothetical protein